MVPASIELEFDRYTALINKCDPHLIMVKPNMLRNIKMDASCYNMQTYMYHHITTER